MPSDPRECLEQAREWVQLANSTMTPATELIMPLWTARG